MTSSDEDIPTYVKDLITKMDFIGHVPPGMKICIRGKYYQDPELWSTKPIRMFYGEDSDTTCDYIDRVVQNLISVLSQKSSIGQRVRGVLKEKALVFRQGLVNLNDTYSQNASASSKLRTILSVLDHHIPVGDEPCIGSAPRYSD